MPSGFDNQISSLQEGTIRLLIKGPNSRSGRFASPWGGRRTDRAGVYALSPPLGETPDGYLKSLVLLLGKRRIGSRVDPVRLLCRDMACDAL